MDTRECRRSSCSTDNNLYVCNICLMAHKKFIHKRILETNSNGLVYVISVFCKECHGKVYCQETEIFIPQYEYPCIILESKLRTYKKD